MFVVAEAGPRKLAIHVRELRGERSLTEMARLAGIRQDELGKIERGETTAIRFDTLLRLCGAFNVDVSDLFTVEADGPEVTLLDEVLDGIRRGDITVHEPVGRGVGPTSAGDVYQDLDEASEVMAAASEPLPARGRRRAPVVRS